jgi:hypothetical protein
MKFDYKHALVIVALVFFVSAPAVAALETGNAVVAQDEFSEDFFMQLIENGAEVVFANIDEEGQPAVIYGQLGVPSEDLGLTDPMYEGCIAMALVATHGELLAYALDLVGDQLFNFTGGDGGDFFAAQFGEGGLNFEDIFDYLGTDFSLMFNVFVNVPESEAASKMGQIRTYMASTFGFSFSVLLDLRIDENTFPPEMEVNLPFDSIHVYIHDVTNTFANAVDAVLDTMDQSGFLQSIDRSVFGNAAASGAGVLAVPDMGALMDLIEGFSNETTSPLSFVTSQMPDLDGPLAIAAAGYIGDQILTSEMDQLDIFGDLLGKSASSTVNALSGGQSLVGVHIPENMNLTSYSPENEAGNVTFYDSGSGMVFWYATAFTNQPDYSLMFEEGNFPPLVTIERTFAPAENSPGGSTVVTVTVANHGPEDIYNVNVTDEGFADRYPLTTVTGDTYAESPSLLGGHNLTFSYTVTFPNEGRYTFDNAIVTYDFDGNTFAKQSHVQGYDVKADPIGLLSQMISDGWPYSGIMIGVVGLGAVVNIVLMMRGGGGGSKVYQV